jgi:hypothetical protein
MFATLTKGLKAFFQWSLSPYLTETNEKNDTNQQQWYFFISFKRY